MTEEERKASERRKKRARFYEESEFPDTDPRKKKPEKPEKEAKKKKKGFRPKRVLKTFAFILLLILLLFLAIFFLDDFLSRDQGREAEASADAVSVAKTLEVTQAPDIEVNLIPVNDYSRGGELLGKVNAIVVHYTGNPGTTAAQNRSYYSGLAVTHESRVSSHFVIGIDGEIVQCIPLAEVSYASNDRNEDTISIECCHLDETGEFTDETYQSLVYLCAYLVGKYDLEPADIIRHYDVTGKACPKYFTDHEDAWDAFLADVENYIAMYGSEKEKTQE